MAEQQMKESQRMSTTKRAIGKGADSLSLMRQGDPSGAGSTADVLGSADNKDYTGHYKGPQRGLIQQTSNSQLLKVEKQGASMMQGQIPLNASAGDK